MFEYLLMIFGINTKKKFITNFLIGVTLAILPMFFLRFIEVRLNDNFSLFLIKLLGYLIFLLHLLSYPLINMKSDQILKLNQQMKYLKMLNSIKKSSGISPAILALILWLMFCSISITFQLVENNIGTMIVHSLNEFNLVYFVKYMCTPITVLYSVSWRVLVRLMYHELNEEY